jgi:hypothetical protein
LDCLFQDEDNDGLVNYMPAAHLSEGFLGWGAGPKKNTLMLTSFVLLGLMACDPLIKTLDSQYVFGDSIRIEITNPCDLPISYNIFLERWDKNDQQWHMVDVDVFASYLSLGAVKDLDAQSSTVLYNLCEGYGEQFLKDYYKSAGLFRYGLEYDHPNAKKIETVYSKEFKITASR